MSAQPVVAVGGVVPAAGASRRMKGLDKRLLPLRGSTVLEQTVGALLDGGVAPLVVVLEPSSPCLELPGLQAATLATNPAPERGMLSSIRVGLAALPASVVAAAVLPGDHAFVPAEAIRRLVERYRQQRPTLLAPSFAGRQGHPLFLSRELFEEAAACDDAVGLRQVVRRHRAELQLLDLPYEEAEQDLDTPEDLGRLD